MKLPADATEAVPQARELVREMSAAELREAVREALEAHWTAYESDGWRSPGWELARRLRAHPDLAELTADEAADVIELVLQELAEAGELRHSDGTVWERALSGSDSTNRHAMNAEQDFLRCWQRVPAPEFHLALRRAHGPKYQDAACFGAALAAPRRAPFRRFLALTLELCRAAEGRDQAGAPLPVATLAGVLDTDRRTAGAWRLEAEELGYLALVEPATNHGGPQGRAASYRWVAVLRRRLSWEPVEKGGPFS